MTTALRPAALSALREGRVQLIYVRADEQNDIQAVVARVTGHYGLYVVDLVDGEWTCLCRGWMDGSRRPCAHIHAVQLVTTYEGAS